MGPRPMLVAAAGMCLAVAAPAAPATAAPRVENAIVKRLNDIRSSRGLPRLRASRGLARAAGVKVREILSSDQLSHTSPDGTPMDRRVRRYVKAKHVGETIAWVSSRKRREAAAVVRSWMRSPAHRATLLAPRFRRIGLARRAGRLGGTRVRVLAANLASTR